MNGKPYLAASVLVVAVACASDMTDSLATFRVRAVRSTLEETVLLTRGETKPKLTTALSRAPIRRIYIQEGENVDGFLVVSVDKIHGEVVLTKDGKTTAIRSVASGIQTSHWAEVVSTQSNAVWRVTVGDSLGREWTIAAISASGVVTASNRAGQAVAIEQEDKKPQPPPAGDVLKAAPEE
jgi:hypothetical protein